MSWKVIRKVKIQLKDPTLIVGLPGIANVGKICVDFIIEELKAKKCYTFFSTSFPNTAFVNENNLIELPSITMHYLENKQLLLLSGDIQPSNEESCYTFCSIIGQLASEFRVKKIITLGGIGLKEEPRLPKLFATGNNSKLVKEFSKKHNIEKQIFGVVGPIMGVSGVLPGLTKIPSLILLAETFGHPFYVGVKGAKEVMDKLNKEFSLGLKTEKLLKGIKEIEEESLEKTKKLQQMFEKDGASYIG